MATPFPGMDPYLEHSDVWPDVHNSLIIALRDYLAPRVRPRYYVSIEQRAYKQEPGGLSFLGRPDVAVVAEPAVAYQVAPTVDLRPVSVITVELPVPDILRETYLDVKDSDGEIITCLEILSPANKVRGRGRSMYEHKRRWVLESRTHLVEIDLLRGGLPMAAAGNGHGMHYRILVSREERRPKADLLPFTVRHPIPDFTLPLQRSDEDVTVPLNTLFHDLYDRAGYDLRVDYRSDPVPPLEGDDTAWANALLCEAGLRALGGPTGKPSQAGSKMSTYHFKPDHYHNTLGSHEPVLRIAAGDTVVTTSADAWGFDARRELVAARANPQTGPFFIEGAEPGDTLVLHLDRLAPNRSYGFSSAQVAPNVVDPGYGIELPRLPNGQRPEAEWYVDVAAGTATLIAPETKLGRLILPLAPMLGCFGVAPAGGQAISTATSGPHGGNMDYRGFVAGVTVYLPVFEPGALIFVGDGHAVQGDGEVAGTGIEISFDVQFTVDLRKGKRIGWPRGENDTHIFTVGNARPLDQALQHATTEMLRWLREDYGLDPLGASILLGQCVEYDLGNMYDPAYTMVCKLAKRFLRRVE